MKGGSDRTKVVLRHLPPTISEAMLMGQIDSVFAGRYDWVSFRPGKNSQKYQTYSRAYIDFKRPEDVFDFAEFFNNHVFVNEKGTQFKTIVEYAPSQRVPKQWSKKDGREGTIHKDPEYLEFLESIAKPVENLPSAEIQLERREAERAGAAKDPPIITPLMDFVRQKRAAKSGSRRLSSNGKLKSRSGGPSSGSSSSASLKRGSEKKRGSMTMYVLRDNMKSITGKDKSTYTLVSKRDGQQVSAAGGDGLEVESGVSVNTDSVKKKVLLLKGKEREILHQQNMKTSVKNLYGSSAPNHNQRHEAAEKTVKSILANKDTRLSQSGGIQSDQKIHTSIVEKDKRPPRSPNVHFVSKDVNGASDDKLVGDNFHGFYSEKSEKRARNKDRPEHVVWTPLRRSDGSHMSDVSLSSSASHLSHIPSYSLEGSAKHVLRRGTSHFVKDADGSLVTSEGKSSRRSSTTGYSSHEKQVWVQKSGPGS